MTVPGNGSSQLFHALFGSMSVVPTTFKLGTVVTVAPLSAQLDGESIVTPDPFIIVDEQLTKYNVRLRNLDSGVTENYEIDNSLKVGDRVITVTANDGQLVYILGRAII